MSRKLKIGYGILAVVLLVAPQVLDKYLVDVLDNVGLYALLGLSLNIVLGDAGLFNMGQAAFCAVGAYVAAILNTKYQIPILYTIPVAGLIAALFAALVARPVIHLRGDYLLIVTISISGIVGVALKNDLFGLTGGDNGIVVPSPKFLGIKIRDTFNFYYLVWAFVAGSVFLFHRLAQSRFGRALNYLREDEVAAEGSGINTTWYKVMAMVIGATWAGMTGALLSAKLYVITPKSFDFDESVRIFLIVILGGSGSIPGILLGAFLVIGLPELFRDFESARMLVFGLVMMVIVIFRSQGLLPLRSIGFKKSDLPNLETTPQ